MTELREINEFLNEKRLAIVGVSREARHFSRAVLKEFLNRGYDVLPVNPSVSEIDGRHCYARVQDVAPKVSAALIMTPTRIAEEVVRDCVTAGVSKVWFYRTGSKDESYGKALAHCREQGVTVISGRCPLMFLPDTAFFHRFHGAMLKLFGRYPK